MLPGEPLVITVCALDEGVDAVCAEAAPRTTARMMAMKTDLLIMYWSWTSLITGSFGMVGLRASAINFCPPSAAAGLLLLRKAWGNAVPEAGQWQGYGRTVSLGQSRKYSLGSTV